MAYHPNPQPNPFWSQATWFIDPQNISGNANDNNTGIDATHPVLSYTHGVAAKWGTNSPTLRQDTTLTWISDANAGGGDGVILTPILVACYCIIRGVLNASRLVTSGVLAGVVSKNRATGTLLQANVGAAPTFSLVSNTTVGKTSFAWVYIAGGVASLSQPLAPAGFPDILGGGVTEVDTWANGDTFETYAPVRINVVRFNVVIAEYDSARGFPDQGVVYQCVLADAVPALFSPGGDTVQSGNDIAMGEVSSQTCFSRIPVTDAEESEYINCVFQAGIQTDPGRGCVFAALEGGIVLAAAVPALVCFYAGNDCIFDGQLASLRVGSVSNTTPSIQTLNSVYIAGTIDICGDALFTQGPIWGPGTLNVNGRCRLSYPSGVGAAVATFLQAGGLLLNGLTTGYAIATSDPALWHPNRTITPAGLDTPVGPGNTFGGLAVNPAGGCIINSNGVA